VMNIFLSYKRDDKEYSEHIEAIYRGLCEEGFEVFRDSVNLRTGDNYIIMLEEAIMRCNVGAVIWTPSSARSEPVTGEALKLVRLKKYCGIILRYNCEPSQFAAIQSANLFEWNQDRNHPDWRQLVSHLHAFGHDVQAREPLETAPPIALEAVDGGLTFPSFVRLDPAGPWRMGSNIEGDGNNSPEVEVIFTSPFALSTGPITVGQWRYAASHGARNLSTDHIEFGADEGAPITNVSWREAQSYVAWLNYRSGTDAYRLPSEAEWEFAASLSRASGTELPAQSFGNIWQWVADSYFDTHDGATEDGSARLESGSSFRVAKGGSWRSPEFQRHPYCRTGFRDNVRADDLGFRVAQDVA
jgi:hypothetical protein